MYGASRRHLGSAYVLNHLLVLRLFGPARPEDEESAMTPNSEKGAIRLEQLLCAKLDFRFGSHAAAGQRKHAGQLRAG